jgi:hypothetical protein
VRVSRGRLDEGQIWSSALALTRGTGVRLWGRSRRPGDMIYSTQQVSSVEPDVLDNTANWIVTHLNSEAEVKLLRGRYEFDRFAEQILHAEDVGFVRIKTQSSRYIIPVQVRLFDADMVAAARDAQTVRQEA